MLPSAPPALLVRRALVSGTEPIETPPLQAAARGSAEGNYTGGSPALPSAAGNFVPDRYEAGTTFVGKISVRGVETLSLKRVTST